MLDVPMEIDVRRLHGGEADANTARQIAAEFAGNNVTPKHAAAFLRDRNNYLIVAEAGETIAGFLSAHRLERFKDTRSKMFIYEVDVAVQWQPRRRP